MKEERPVFVVGHKNPDTDSVCAAIAYARLKTIVTGRAYEPRRAGHLNEETSYVLDRFGVDKPLMLTDVRTQVKDLEIRNLSGASGGGTSFSLFTFMHWRRKWQPTPVFLPGESQGRGSLVGCRL